MNKCTIVREEHVLPVEPYSQLQCNRFQYILAAPTSIATKYGDPSLTYINQGQVLTRQSEESSDRLFLQSYEIKIKKLGDLSCHYRKKWLRSTIRICFHERRLQYIESEQIAEWARSKEIVDVIPAKPNELKTNCQFCAGHIQTSGSLRWTHR